KQIRVQPRLIAVPHVPSTKDPFERAVAHGAAKDLVDRIAQRYVLRRQYADVMTDGDRFGLNREPGHAAMTALGEHLIEEHRVGVSSRPLRPMSASPRTIDCTIDVKVIVMNSGVRPSPRAIRFAISTSKPTRRSGCRGSASTNGAPPSGSPAHRKTLAGSAAP